MKAASKIVCFGEIMMRLNPPGFERIVQANMFEVSYAGSEANVSVALSNFGVDSAFVTRLPDSTLGASARNALRRYGVDTSRIVWGGPRVGVYYVERGASQRPSNVIYDRVGSSMQMASRGDFDWDSILDGACWFHFSGITPALGRDCPSICQDALKECKRRGVVVSCDLNYRSKLWNKEQAYKVMSELVPLTDVVIANESDIADVFDIRAGDTDVEHGILRKDAYEEVASQVVGRFGAKQVAITLRTSISASINKWAGMLFDGSRAYISPEHTIVLVDRLGGGDAFAAGIVYALSSGMNGQDAINFAVSASCLKQTIEHDFNLVTVDEVKTLAIGNSSGRVQR